METNKHKENKQKNTNKANKKSMNTQKGLIRKQKLGI